jgi:hypothetical protein
VSCTSAKACTAVGQHQNSSEVTLPVAEGWNGTKWAIEPPPAPAAQLTAPWAACRASPRNVPPSG